MIFVRVYIDIDIFFCPEGWFRAILPKSALIVEEKSWNAYPYTKTIYRCPFIEKFNLEIETKYFCDEGCQENVFNLTGAELRNRTLGKCIGSLNFKEQDFAMRNYVSFGVNLKGMVVTDLPYTLA